MQEIVSKKLEDNIKYLDEQFTDSPDVKRQKLLLKDGTPALLVYVEGLIDTSLLQRDILPSLMNMESSNIFDESLQIANLPSANTILSDNLKVLISYILSGWPVICINGFDRAIAVNLIKYEKRGISEATMEKNVKGSNEAFIESLNTNISVLRRSIKNERLKFKMIVLGDITNQSVAIGYIEDLANPKIVEVLSKKIKEIKYDGLFDVGYIEQLIADNQITPFPHYMSTERPDKTVSCLLEGMIAILLDGTPSALLAPVSFFSFFQAPDDYNGNWMVASLIRLLRMFGLIIALFLPALYIAIVSYHYYMIPLNLLIPLAESRARVPFPPIIEVLILETTLEMIREATIRLPTFIATSLGVVGGLIIGQAAVDAGIVSNIIIIVVSITAIASFLIPNYDMALTIRYIRFIVMFFAAIFGIIGVVISGVFLLAHLVILESMGEPYFKPMFPFRLNDFKDTLLRPSLKALRKRPSIAHPLDKSRGKK
ncbi:MAG: spore gernimation protein [Clostridiales bacterium GWB2_37_7]|nr:MAG: spore gernimation protein [Clostridiales bacterium GWB2_37_7]